MCIICTIDQKCVCASTVDVGLVRCGKDSDLYKQRYVVQTSPFICIESYCSSPWRRLHPTNIVVMMLLDVDVDTAARGQALLGPCQGLPCWTVPPSVCNMPLLLERSFGTVSKLLQHTLARHARWKNILKLGFSYRFLKIQLFQLNTPPNMQNASALLQEWTQTAYLRTS